MQKDAESERAVILLSGDVVRWADESEHVGDFFGSVEFLLVLGQVGGELICEEVIEVFVEGLIALLFGFEERSHLAQLTRIEPDAGTLGTFVNLDLAFDAEEVAHHNNATFGALEPLRVVEAEIRVSLDVEEYFAVGFVRLVEFFELQIVEPDSATTCFAYIDGDIANGHLPELI